MLIYMHLANNELYNGCQIDTINNRQQLVTVVPDAILIVKANIEKIIANQQDKSEVTIYVGEDQPHKHAWAYMLVFQAVSQHFNKVYYKSVGDPPTLLYEKC